MGVVGSAILSNWTVFLALVILLVSSAVLLLMCTVEIRRRWLLALGQYSYDYDISGKVVYIERDFITKMFSGMKVRSLAIGLCSCLFITGFSISGMYNVIQPVLEETEQQKQEKLDQREISGLFILPLEVLFARSPPKL